MYEKYIFMLIFVSCLMLFGTKEAVLAKEMPKETINIVFLNGTDETKDGFPVYELMNDNKSFWDIYNQTFIKKSIFTKV